MYNSDSKGRLKVASVYNNWFSWLIIWASRVQDSADEKLENNNILIDNSIIFVLVELMTWGSW